MDSVARKLRMYEGATAAPILSVDDHGSGCVAPTPVVSPWYGPSITQLFVGAWSFHPMNAPLDVWSDDLVVDTKPIACPPRSCDLSAPRVRSIRSHRVKSRQKGPKKAWSARC
jgi:hypothetical protein